MRVGSQGLEGRAPHDHDDALSIWVFRGDTEFIVEEGCHSYTLDDEIRCRNLSSRAHNLVQERDRDRYLLTEGSISKTVRGAETASSWLHNARADSCELSADLEISGRKGQTFRRCSRAISLFENSRHDILSVEDYWVWSGKRDAELRWHFGPRLKPVMSRDFSQFAIIGGEGSELATIKLSSNRRFETEVFAFEYSPDYGAVEACQGLRCTIPVHKEATFETVICFER